MINMEFAKVAKKFTEKKCAFHLCENTFEGSQFESFCKDPRCIALRRKFSKRSKEIIKNNTDTNLIIPKNSKENGETIEIHCEAMGPNGRCQTKFTVMYESNRTVYPRFCHHHTNEYKRKLFEEGKVLCHGSQSMK